jgi:ABC-type lipoprotein release transport system permease subunit
VLVFSLVLLMLSTFIPAAAAAEFDAAAARATPGQAVGA